MHDSYDLIVIGAGPGGYVAAIRAAQLKMKVAVIEREKQLGGTCLRVGCIPSKALLETSELFERSKHHFAERGIIVGSVSVDLPKMMQHKDSVVSTLGKGIEGLLKKNKIDRYIGTGRLTAERHVVVSSDESASKESPSVESKVLTAQKILLATGSVSASFPGMEPDGDRIGTSTEALSWPEVPEHLVVIGAGVIGLELGTVWRRLGSKVTVLEFLPRILPGIDSQVARDAQRILTKQGIEFQLATKVLKTFATEKSCVVKAEGKDPIECDRILIAVGRRPCIEGLGLDVAGVQTDERGFVRVNAKYETTAQNIYAIGDLIGGAMLAHKAEEEGVACVEMMQTNHGHVNYGAIPAVIYTSPEIASVGETEDELKERDAKFRSGRFLFAANGRARAAGHIDGSVKILADAETDRVLGVHIIGAHAGELIAEAAVAMEFGASSEDIARCCHAHPTLAEAVKEAALAVDKRAIHA